MCDKKQLTYFQNKLKVELFTHKKLTQYVKGFFFFLIPFPNICTKNTYTPLKHKYKVTKDLVLLCLKIDSCTEF